MAVSSTGTASGQTVGGTTVNISGIASNFNSTTVTNGVRFLVVSTGANQNYTYHKATLREDDLLSISGDINDFSERYRVGSSNPTTSLDNGDLFFNTSTGKMLVYNGTNTAWEEVQSIGNFFISTLSPAFDGSTQNFTLSDAPTNAQQVLLIIEGVVQKPNAGTSTPTEGFALDGNTVKLAAAPATGASYHAVVMGSTVNIGTPSNNTVTTDILQNSCVTSAKIVDGTIVNADIAANAAIDASKIANLSTDSITEGNSKAEIIDTGTGEFKVALDGTDANLSLTPTLFNLGRVNSKTHIITFGDIRFSVGSGIQPYLRLTNLGYLEVTGAYGGGSSIGQVWEFGGYQGTHISGGNIKPSADSSYDLGTNTVRWQNVYADNYYGSAANLTSIPAANITGTLPAIDGSNLTGVSSQKADGCVTENSQTISNNYTMTAGKSGISAGPITIANNVTVNIQQGSRYVIV